MEALEPAPRGRVAAVLVAVLAVLVGVTPPLQGRATAQPATAPAPAQTGEAVTVTVLDQSRSIPPEGTLNLSLRLDGPRPDGSELFVEVYPQVEGDDAAFDRAAAGEFTTSTVGPGPAIYPLDAEDFQPDTGGRLDLAIPTFVARADQRIGTVRLAVAGVYPIRISVRDGDTNATLGQTVTFVVRLPAEVEGPLATALIVPLEAPPSTPADPNAATVVDAAAVSRWQAVLGALATRPDVPVSVVPRPETVATLAGAATPSEQAVRTALAAPVEDRQVLAPPYVAVDAAALVGQGLAGELTDQLSRGEEALDDRVAVRPDRRTWLADPDLDAPTARHLEQLAVDQWVVPATALAPLDPQVAAVSGEPDPGTSHRARARVDDLDLEAVAVPDPGLSAAFAAGAGHEGGVRFLAHLAFRWFQADEGQRAGRGVVLVTPSEWVPDGDFVATVLGGLAQDPLLRPVTIDGWFRSVAPLTGADGQPVVRPLTPAVPPDLGGLPALLDSGHRQLGTLASFLPAGEATEEWQRLDQGLAVAASSALPPEARPAYVAQITARNDELKEAVAPLEAETITLTSRRAAVNVTLENERAEPVRTLVQLTSSKLAITQPERQVVLTPGQPTPLEFQVEARSTGTFGLTVSVRSPDSAILMRRSRWTIRSTAVTGVGWILSIGGLVFLAVWWVLHARRARRGEQAELGASRRRHPSGRRRHPGSRPA